MLAGWPLRVGWLLVPALLVLSADVALSWLSLHAPYGLWAATNAAWREHLVVVGPLLCAAGCLYAGRISQGRASLLNRHTASGPSPWSRLARHSAVVAAWGCAAHVLGVVAETIHTTATATHGGLDVLVIVHALLGLVTYAVLGVAAGLVLRSPAWAVPVLAVTAVWGLLPTFSARWLGALGPVEGWQMTGWDAPNHAVLAYSLAFCVAVAATAGAAYAMRATRTTRHRVDVLVPLAAVIALGIGAAAWRPMLALQDQVTEQCQTTRASGHPVDVCLNPAYARSRSHVEAAVKAIDTTAGVPLFTSVHESRSGVRGAGVAHVELTPTEPATDLVDALAISSTFDPLQACSEGDQSASTLSPAASTEVDTRNTIATMLTQLANTGHLDKPADVPSGTPQARLWSMTPAQLRAYLRAQAGNLQTCGHLELPR